MKIGQKEKIMLLILVVILIGGLGYNFILSPLKTEVKELQTKNDDLTIKHKEFIAQFANQGSIDKNLVIKKSEAIQLSKTLISGKTVASVYLKMKNIFEQNVIIDILQLGGSFTEIPFITVDEAGVPTEDTELKIRSIEYNLSYSCPNPAVLNTMLINWKNNYPFILVTTYNIPELKQTNDPINKYSGIISGKILVATGELNIYNKDVFQCPHTVDGPNGTQVLCGQWNAYNGKTCFLCKKPLDYCPNADCHTLLTGNESQCPVCDSELVDCNSCGKKALYATEVCVKCGKSVSGT